jgi:AcrR family transcriptional regulator
MSIVTVADVDGRRARRAHNRDAVVDALIELFDEGLYQPSSAEIAERAGLSPRSLFRYFDDVDDLNRAAIERELGAALPLLDLALPADATLDDKIDRIVDSRSRLFETIAPAARAARIAAHRRPIVATHLRDSRAFLRGQVYELFSSYGAELLPALDALCSFETYELLRYDQRLSRPQTTTALTTALRALLEVHRESPSHT